MLQLGISARPDHESEFSLALVIKRNNSIRLVLQRALIDKYCVSTFSRLSVSMRNSARGSLPSLATKAVVGFPASITATATLAPCPQGILDTGRPPVSSQPRHHLSPSSAAYRVLLTFRQFKVGCDFIVVLVADEVLAHQQTDCQVKESRE